MEGYGRYALSSFWTRRYSSHLFSSGPWNCLILCRLIPYSGKEEGSVFSLVHASEFGLNDPPSSCYDRLPLCNWLISKNDFTLCSCGSFRLQWDMSVHASKGPVSGSTINPNIGCLGHNNQFHYHRMAVTIVLMCQPAHGISGRIYILMLAFIWSI